MHVNALGGVRCGWELRVGTISVWSEIGRVRISYKATLGRWQREGACVECIVSSVALCTTAVRVLQVINFLWGAKAHPELHCAEPVGLQ